MKVTILGHASTLIEMHGVRCLMDPVFYDPFEEGVVVSCPKRVVHVDKLPPIDLLVISHGHLDHFDIPSLAKVSRKCDVLCPKDKAIVYALQQLGFKKIHDTNPFTHIKRPTYEVMTTHSNVSNVIEFGMIFKDKTGTFWNQVDTRLSPDTIQKSLVQAGKIDLLFAMFASQNFGFFESRGTGFPYKMHEMNLSTVAGIAPRVVVPGAAGFRFCGPVEWCNAFMFPMSRERFIADLSRVAPAVESRIANPGDVLELEGGRVHHHVAASAFAETIEDDSAALRFDPTAPTPPLSDPNPSGYSSERLRATVEEAIEGFSSFLKQAHALGDPVVDEYKRLRASYAIGVVFPDATERWYRFQCDDDQVRVESGATVTPADAGHRIVASALAAWLSREKSYFYLRGFSRKFSMLYSIAGSGESVSIEAMDPQDLLAYYMDRKAKGAELAVKSWLDAQLKPFLRRRD